MNRQIALLLVLMMVACAATAIIVQPAHRPTAPPVTGFAAAD